MSVKDTNAVVTGGSRGLGIEMVEALVAQGASAMAVACGTEAWETDPKRFGVPMPRLEFAEKVVSVLDDPKYAAGRVFGLKGDTGITMLEGAAA